MNAIIDCMNLTNVTIGKDIQSIQANSITTSTTAAAEVTFKTPYSAALDTNIADNFIKVFDGSILIISDTWKEHINGKVWKGITWSDILFMDAEGNVTTNGVTGDINSGDVWPA